MNQNEITNGRLKRSQTRIAPGVEIRQAGSRRADCGQGVCEVSQSSWATFASPSSDPLARGTANSGSGQRLASLSSPSVPSSLCSSVLTTAITMIAAKIRPTMSE